jgi:hypothetical protein
MKLKRYERRLASASLGCSIKSLSITIILDPELALHAPETLWLGSGTRAMDHAIEALCAKNGSPLVDTSVLRSIALMARMLPQSRANPTPHVPHYLCTPVIMPGILHYNEPATEEAQKELAIALGRPDIWPILQALTDPFRLRRLLYGLPCKFVNSFAHGKFSNAEPFSPGCTVSEANRAFNSQGMVVAVNC